MSACYVKWAVGSLLVLLALDAERVASASVYQRIKSFFFMVVLFVVPSGTRLPGPDGAQLLASRSQAQSPEVTWRAPAAGRRPLLLEPLLVGPGICVYQSLLSGIKSFF